MGRRGGLEIPEHLGGALPTLAAYPQGLEGADLQL